MRDERPIALRITTRPVEGQTLTLGAVVVGGDPASAAAAVGAVAEETGRVLVVRERGGALTVARARVGAGPPALHPGTLAAAAAVCRRAADPPRGGRPCAALLAAAAALEAIAGGEADVPLCDPQGV